MIRAFGEDDLDAAAVLLAERHRRHLAAEPLLAEEPDFRAEVEALRREDGASGTVTDGAFVVGVTRSVDRWGPNVWIESAGHAAREPELARDVYAAAAAEWAERGLTAQYAVVPAADRELVDAWFRLGFGAQQAYGAREVRDAAWPAGARLAGEGDVDELVVLAPLLWQHQSSAPVFSGTPRPSEDVYRASVLEDIAHEDVGNLVFERDGRIVANFIVCSAELATSHPTLAIPPRAAYLAIAITRPEARGSGAGVALTDACLAWARERGFTSMITDWRITNLLASRFWPKRGFRTSFLRLHRLIA